MNEKNLQSMSAGSVEERVIQYMDGELGDAERAELLHRASVSPEIRQLFAEHEQLQQLSQRALLASSISPALEERVLAHVSELAAAERRRTGYFWLNRWYRLSAALLLVGGLGYGLYELGTSGGRSNSERVASKNTSSDSQSGTASAHGSQTSPDVASSGTRGSTISTSLSTDQSENTSQTTSSAALSSWVSRELHATKRVFAVQQHGPRVAEFQMPSDLHTPSPTDEHIPSRPSATDQATLPSTVAVFESVPVVAPHRTAAAIGGSTESGSATLPRIRPIDVDRSAGISAFELGLQTSSGFSYPASGPTVHPFADFRANLSYFLSEHDVVGLRVTSGIFQTLPSIVRSTTSSAVVIHRELSEQRELAEEVFYGHRFLLSSQSGLALEIAAGAGLIPQGNTFSLELGFKLPFGEHLTGTAGFSVMRIHSTAPLMRDVISSEASNAGEMPIIFQGSDIRNTLNGRIQYGLAYRF